MFENIIITDIKGVFTVTSPKGRYEEMKNRKYYGLSFCKSGQITYIQDDKEVISDENCAVLLPEGKNYIIRGGKSGAFPVINFTCEGTLCDRVTAISIQNNEVFLKDFEKLKSLSISKQSKAEMMSVFYHMIHKLSQQNRPCEAIMPAILYIDNNYKNPKLSIAVLAQLCNISEIYFRRLFSKHFGISPKQYLINLRIERAKQLLSEGALKINVIATECGFSGQYHFCRIFKEKTGLTPTEYMKRHIIVKI